MHGEFKHMPTAFHRSNVACVQVLLNLIAVLIICQTDGGAIMTFEDILGDVPDRILGDAYFHIYVTIVSKQRKISLW